MHICSFVLQDTHKSLIALYYLILDLQLTSTNVQVHPVPMVPVQMALISSVVPVMQVIQGHYVLVRFTASDNYVLYYTV